MKIKGASLLFGESHSPPTIIKNICEKQPLKRDHKRGACRTAQNFSIRLEKHNNTPEKLRKSTQSRLRRINFSLSSPGESDAFLVFQPQ